MNENEKGECEMKRNCQLYTAKAAYDNIFAHTPKDGVIEHVKFIESGYLTWFEGGLYKCLSPNDVAYKLNMPLWEIVGVVEDGVDTYGILLFEN